MRCRDFHTQPGVPFHINLDRIEIYNYIQIHAKKAFSVVKLSTIIFLKLFFSQLKQ